MSSKYVLTMKTRALTLNAYDEKTAYGILTKDGVGFKGQITVSVQTRYDAVSIPDGSNIASDDEGNFQFKVESAWSDPHLVSTHEEILSATITCAYYNPADHGFAEDAIGVTVKPTPI